MNGGKWNVSARRWRDGTGRVRFHRPIHGGGNETFFLSMDEAEYFADSIRLVLCELRRGRILDGVAWCAGCGEHPVNPAAGQDTCPECLATL